MDRQTCLLTEVVMLTTIIFNKGLCISKYPDMAYCETGLFVYHFLTSKSQEEEQFNICTTTITLYLCYVSIQLPDMTKAAPETTFTLLLVCCEYLFPRNKTLPKAGRDY